jgi:hypothetical protein
VDQSLFTPKGCRSDACGARNVRNVVTRKKYRVQRKAARGGGSSIPNKVHHGRFLRSGDESRLRCCISDAEVQHIVHDRSKCHCGANLSGAMLNVGRLHLLEYLLHRRE